MKNPFLIVLPFLIMTGLSVPASAAPSCASFAEEAAARHGVPAKLMSAISLVETQRNGRSWPWTLNEGGQGHYFATKGEALAYLEDAVARGVRNIDVGCMQLNFRWHAAGFTSLDAMLDPRANTNYAALFLTELKQRLGSWEEATKHYHSSDDQRGSNYRDKVVAAEDGQMKETEGSPELAMQDVPLGSVGGQGEPLIAVADTSEDSSAWLVRLAAAADAETARTNPPGSMRARSELPWRLRQRWDEIEQLRNVLATAASP